MKAAVLLHGNLRTFFMPSRENGTRLCDMAVRNIVGPNNADVFIITETRDYFFDNKQWFHEEDRQNIEKNDKISYDVAFYDNIDFTRHDKAKSMLEQEIGKVFEESLKGIEIRNVIDISSDPKYVLLSTSGSDGYPPILSVNQYIKLKAAWRLMLAYEEKNSCRYDIIFRGRLDNMYDTTIKFEAYDYSLTDIFVPGAIKDLFIYDWAALGTRMAMELSTNMYDHLGYTLSNRLYRCACNKCRTVTCGPRAVCPCGGEMTYDEMTLAIEYHLMRMFKDRGIRFRVQLPVSPYRYRKT